MLHLPDIRLLTDLRFSKCRVWFGYEGKTSNKLKVVSQGEDGLKEMVDETSSAEQLYVPPYQSLYLQN